MTHPREREFYEVFIGIDERYMSDTLVSEGATNTLRALVDALLAVEEEAEKVVATLHADPRAKL